MARNFFDGSERPDNGDKKPKVQRIRESFGDWRDDLQRGENGILPNARNAALILTRDPGLAGVFAFNEFSCKPVLTKAPPETLGITAAGTYPRAWEKSDRSLVLIYLQTVYHPGFKPETISTAIDAAALERKFHPVRQYLAGLEWDGTPRIGTWLTDCFGVEPTPYSHAVGKKFLQAAVRRIRIPGCKFDPMLVLEGPQDIGKSLACEALFGQWFTDHLPAELGDKDTLGALQGVWGVEFAEIEQVLRSEAEAFKAFMTRKTDKYRPPYGAGEVERPRQCVFIGTTNRNDYARDETGNRRLWPVLCQFAKADWIKEWRDQLWAEAAATEPNATLWLEDADVRAEARAQQAARHDTEVWEDKILDWVEDKTGYITVSDILSNALEIATERHSKFFEHRVSKVLRRNGWINTTKRVNGKPRKVWLRVTLDFAVHGNGAESGCDQELF